MKNYFIISFCFLLLTCSLNAQRSVDAVFERYGDREGYVTLRLDGSLLKFSGLFEDEYDDDGISGEITEIRILARDNKDHGREASRNHLTDEVSTRGYEEFMSVRDSDGDFRVLIKSRGRALSELLVLAGGRENLIVQVKGNISKKDARRISEHFRTEQRYNESDEEN